MEDCQRLNIIINKLKLTPNAFSKEIGLERPEIIYNVLKGKNGISRKLASLITTKYTNISYSWLVSGEGEPFVINKPNEAEMDALVREKMTQYNKSHGVELDNILKLIEEKDKRIKTLEKFIEHLQEENKRLRNV